MIHHAWNDSKVRVQTSLYRGVYAHTLKVFGPPSSQIDRFLVRVSIIYRYILFRIGKPALAFVENSTLLFLAKPIDLINPDELKPYQRNLETMIGLGILEGIKIVLTTMPHSIDPQKNSFQPQNTLINAMRLCETSLKKIGKNLFVDSDQLMTGQMQEVFRDVAHVTSTGRAFKAIKSATRH